MGFEQQRDRFRPLKATEEPDSEWRSKHLHVISLSPFEADEESARLVWHAGHEVQAMAAWKRFIDSEPEAESLDIVAWEKLIDAGSEADGLVDNEPSKELLLEDTSLPWRFSKRNLLQLIEELAPCTREHRLLLYQRSESLLEIWLTGGEAFLCTHPSTPGYARSYWEARARQLPDSDPLQHYLNASYRSNIMGSVRLLHDQREREKRLVAQFGERSSQLHDHMDEDFRGTLLTDAWWAVQQLEDRGAPWHSLDKLKEHGERPIEKAALTCWRAAREQARVLSKSNDYAEALDVLTSLPPLPWYEDQHLDLAHVYDGLGWRQRADEELAHHLERVRPYPAICGARWLISVGKLRLARQALQTLRGAPFFYGVAAMVEEAKLVSGEEQRSILRDAKALAEDLRRELGDQGNLVRLCQEIETLGKE